MTSVFSTSADQLLDVLDGEGLRGGSPWRRCLVACSAMRSSLLAGGPWGGTVGLAGDAGEVLAGAGVDAEDARPR